jgi:microsomal dipeptidase-like Zn-dependent dipeptidase
MSPTANAPNPASWPKPLYEIDSDLSDLDSPFANSANPFEFLVNTTIFLSKKLFGALGFSDEAMPFIVAGVFIAAIAGGLIVFFRNVARYVWSSFAPAETPVPRPAAAEDDPNAKQRRPKRSARLPSLYWGIALPFALSLALISLGFDILPALVDRSMNKVLKLNPADKPSAASLAFHNSLDFIGDLHADSLMWTHRGTFLDPALPSFSQVSLPLLEKGNVALQVLSSVTRTPAGQNMHSNSNTTRDNIDLLTFIQRWNRETYSGDDSKYIERTEVYSKLMGLASKYSRGKLIWVKSKSDLDKLVEQRATNKSVTGALLSIEGSALCIPELIGPQECAGKLYHLGVRMVGLTHFIDLAVGASATGTTPTGLSDYGRDFVRRLFELNIIVDFAHVHSTTVMDVLRLHDSLEKEPKPPMVVSHTGFRAICNHSRNLGDDLAGEMVKRGTLLGVAFFPQAICGDTVEDVVDGFRYAADKWGIDSVGLGSDYDGGFILARLSTRVNLTLRLSLLGAVAVPFDIGDLSVLTHSLLNYGRFTQEEVAKILGTNLLRVLRAGLPEH